MENNKKLQNDKLKLLKFAETNLFFTSRKTTKF